MTIVTTFSPALSPTLTVCAQTPQKAPWESAYCLSNSCLVVSASPSQLLNSPLLEMMPIEILQALMLKEVSIDPLEAHHLTVSILPTLNPPSYSFTAQFASPIVGKLKEQFTQHTQPGELAGRPHLISSVPQLPSLYFPADKTLVAAPEATLQKLVQGNSSRTSDELQNRLLGATTDDFYACLDITPLRPLIQLGLMHTEIPETFKPFTMAPNYIHYIELRLNLTGGGPTEIIVEANDETDANELMGLVEQAFDIVRQQVHAEADRLLQDPDPVQQATGRYQKRLVSKYSTTLKPTVEGNRLVLFRMQPGDGASSALTMTAVSGVLVALLLPAIQAAREAARRNTSMNNIKQIMLSLLNYESAHGHFPAHASCDDTGKPLLSWRVHMLPYLDQTQLYDRFHLDEPWDSEHNLKIISLIPELFLDPSSRLQVTDGRPHYLGVQGSNSIFQGLKKEGIRFRDIIDGSSNTLAILQVNDEYASIWTQPKDWEMDKRAPLRGLSNSLHPGIFLGGICDGSVHSISVDIDPTTFKHLLMFNDGQVVNYD